MPLVHNASNKARQENIKRELESHPDMNPKQAVAIGYSVQRSVSKEREDHEKRKYGK